MDAFYIKNGFTAFIHKKTVKHPIQRQFLLNHERRHIAETNVQKEIKALSLRWGARCTKKQVEQLMEAGATIFCDCALAAKIRELISEAEFKRQESVAGELADTQAMVDEWTKEAQSTAVTKAVADTTGFRNVAGQENLGDGNQLGGSLRDGPTVHSSGGDSAMPRVNSSPV